MDHKQFLESLDWINRDLSQLKVNRAYKSLAWNIFFEFGKNMEILCPNGKTRDRKEWRIWIGASWRITKDQKYYIGSATPAILKQKGDYFINKEEQENLLNTSDIRQQGSELSIYQALQVFLEKRFVSLNINSSFLDAEFVFEDGYKIITFFNCFDKLQWLMYLPDKTEIFVDCSTKKVIEDAQNLSKKLKIKLKYKKSAFSLSVTIDDITYKNDGFSILAFENVILETGESAWRITKSDKYVIGRLDHFYLSQEGKEQKYRDKISQLVGKKIKCLEIDDSEMDARIQFDDGYALELFTTGKSNQWSFLQNGKPVLCTMNYE